MGFLTPKGSRKREDSKSFKKAAFASTPEAVRLDQEEQKAAKQIGKIARGRSARAIVEAKSMKIRAVAESADGRVSGPPTGRVSFASPSQSTIGTSSGPPPSSPLEDLLAAMLQCSARCLAPKEEEEVPRPSSKIASADTEAPARLSSTVDRELLHFVSSSKLTPLSPELMSEVEGLFKAMDDDGDGAISFEEARRFWGSNFSKINAQAMFNEVDDDINGSITFEEWIDFWRNVIAQEEYEEEDVIEELKSIKAGGSWVDWNDGRETGETPLTLAIKAHTKGQAEDPSTSPPKESETSAMSA